MRVLIIGGTNFIGPPLVRRRIAHGLEVAVFHRRQTQADLPVDVEPILGDRHDLGRTSPVTSWATSRSDPARPSVCRTR